MIPHQLGNLYGLRSLDLGSFDAYSWSNYRLFADTMEWLHGLSSLEDLDVSYVDLSQASDWLLELNKLSSLLKLRMSSCALHDIPSLPRVNFTFLTVLDLSYNYFNGIQIPIFIVSWPV